EDLESAKFGDAEEVDLAGFSDPVGGEADVGVDPVASCGVWEAPTQHRSVWPANVQDEALEVHIRVRGGFWLGGRSRLGGGICRRDGWLPLLGHPRREIDLDPLRARGVG